MITFNPLTTCNCLYASSINKRLSNYTDFDNLQMQLSLLLTEATTVYEAFTQALAMQN